MKKFGWWSRLYVANVNLHQKVAQFFVDGGAEAYVTDALTAINLPSLFYLEFGICRYHNINNKCGPSMALSSLCYGSTTRIITPTVSSGYFCSTQSRTTSAYELDTGRQVYRKATMAVVRSVLAIPCHGIDHNKVDSEWISFKDNWLNSFACLVNTQLTTSFLLEQNLIKFRNRDQQGDFRA